MFIMRKRNIEAKWSKLLLNFKFSEAKWTHKIVCRRQVSMSMLKNGNIEMKQSKLLLNCESCEANRTCEAVKILFWSEANMFI
jgi:hypothetical protein